MSISVRAKDKVHKGKGKGQQGKGGKQNWRQACSDYWRPDGCNLRHHCPKFHPRRQPGRGAICSSTRQYTSQRQYLVKPKAKTAEYEDDSTWQAEAMVKNTRRGKQRSMMRLEAKG